MKTDSGTQSPFALQTVLRDPAGGAPTWLPREPWNAHWSSVYCLRALQLVYLARSDKVLLNSPSQHLAAFTSEVCGHLLSLPPLPTSDTGKTRRWSEVSWEPNSCWISRWPRLVLNRPDSTFLWVRVLHACASPPPPRKMVRGLV